jgi:hypothetical protein
LTSRRKVFELDKLTFEQGVEFFARHFDLIRGFLD